MAVGHHHHCHLIIFEIYNNTTKHQSYKLSLPFPSPLYNTNGIWNQNALHYHLEPLSHQEVWQSHTTPPPSSIATYGGDLSPPKPPSPPTVFPSPHKTYCSPHYSLTHNTPPLKNPLGYSHSLSTPRRALALVSLKHHKVSLTSSLKLTVRRELDVEATAKTRSPS